MPPAAEVYIQATATDPDVRAKAVIESAHRDLLDRLTALTAAESGAQSGDAAGQEAAVAVAEQLSRVLTATDQTLYAAASGAAATRVLIRALRAAADTIGRQGESLTAAQDDAARTAAARVLQGMLTVHLDVERAVLLPSLAELPGVDLAVLAADFGTVAEGGRLEESDVVDVREIPHGRRHPRIFTRFGRLAAGESFVLVNNHDPKPLRREFEATHPDGFSWEYLESGPEQWQVRITRVAGDA